LGYSESPLIIDELVIVTPGGKDGTVLALNKHTGEMVWQSSELTDPAHYSSAVATEIQGVRQIIQFSATGVFGLDSATGGLLWNYAAPANSIANCCTPIVSGNFVLASSGYGRGSGLVQIGREPPVREVYFQRSLACDRGEIVKLGDYVYSAADAGLACMAFATGKIMWKVRGAGKGSICAADGMLYVLGENHQVVLAEANPDGYFERGRFRIPDHGHPAWSLPVVTGGRIYLRDQESLTAYNLRFD
jgi:outer membrane protein assembly factor BamB